MIASALNWWEPNMSQTLPGFLLTVFLLACGTWSYYHEEGWDWKLGVWCAFFIPGTIFGVLLLI